MALPEPLDAATIRAWRTDRRVTQADLAERAGITPARLSGWERGAWRITAPDCLRSAMAAIDRDPPAPPRPRRPPRPCTVDGCPAPHVAKGWCRRHYGRLRYGRDLATGQSLTPRPSPPLRPRMAKRSLTPPPCMFDGCTRPLLATGWCRLHYDRLRRGRDLATGRPLTPRPPRPPRPPRVCAIDGCDGKACSRGWCPKHYVRWRTHGDPLVTPARVERRKLRYYWMLNRRGHVLAGATGQVFEHRLVLFERIGPGWHTCHWCGCPVMWAVKHYQWEAALVVDHLDDDGFNNDPSNLVPSCKPCNRRRRG